MLLIFYVAIKFSSFEKYSKLKFQTWSEIVNNAWRGLPGTFSGESEGQGAEPKIGEKIPNFHFLRKPPSEPTCSRLVAIRSINKLTALKIANL